MSAMTTLAPASASAVAIPSPMPEAAPVTIAVLPEMSIRLSFALPGFDFAGTIVRRADARVACTAVEYRLEYCLQRGLVGRRGTASDNACEDARTGWTRLRSRCWHAVPGCRRHWRNFPRTWLPPQLRRPAPSRR